MNWIYDVLYDARWLRSHGIGRLAGELRKLLPHLIPYRARRRPFHPFDPVLLGVDLSRKKPKLFLGLGYNPPVGMKIVTEI
jgi:hypothetical protein